MLFSQKNRFCFPKSCSCPVHKHDLFSSSMSRDSIQMTKLYLAVFNALPNGTLFTASIRELSDSIKVVDSVNLEKPSSLRLFSRSTWWTRPRTETMPSDLRLQHWLPARYLEPRDSIFANYRMMRRPLGGDTHEGRVTQLTSMRSMVLCMSAILSGRECLPTAVP